MVKKRKKKKSKHLDPLEVLQGRVPVTALELVRLIHRINPTKRDLKKKEKAELYRLKADLQSLLINEFPESLEVRQEDRNNPDLLSLHLKYFVEDACHTLLSELDAPARSWAQKQIDLLTLADNHTGEKLDGKAADTDAVAGQARSASEKNVNISTYSRAALLRMGQQALAEYDYESCEQYFRHARDRNHHDPESTVALLALYVDHLAAYDQAILLGNSLTGQLKKNQQVKELLALALVRSGQAEEALARLGKNVSSRGLEVYLLAGMHFVKNGDIKRAVACHSRLDMDDTPELRSEILRLAEAINELRTGSLKPIEEKMLKAWEQGEAETAVQLADELLDRDTGNREARRIRNLFTARQQQDRRRK